MAFKTKKTTIDYSPIHMNSNLHTFGKSVHFQLAGDAMEWNHPALTKLTQDGTLEARASTNCTFVDA